MDTIIDVTFYNTENYQEHYQKIKDIYNLYDELADDFVRSTKVDNVKKLNDNRKIENASFELIELISESISLCEKTNGHFNPLIGRLSHLWKESIQSEEPYILSEELIQSELEIMNSSKIIIEGNNISISGLANIDLGAIAKGYATNKAKEYLDSVNVTGYMINAGASSLTVGVKGEEEFKIGLSKPLGDGLIEKIQISNLSVGTSSYKYQHKVVDNSVIHHLLNPFTGYPSNNYTNVNVLCDNATLCDAYSTALFSISVEDAIKFASDNNIDILLFDDEILYRSEKFVNKEIL
jgi:thiamine biosynthesis lipoprotein